MQLEDYFEFNAEPVEHIRIKGTRIDIDMFQKNGEQRNAGIVPISQRPLSG